MTRVKMSSLVSGVAGKFNGSQFQNTTNGLVLVNKSTPPKKFSSSLLTVKSFFKNGVVIWNSLSEAQKNANSANAVNYPLYDQFGNMYNLSGYALLQRSNMNLQIIGQSTISVVPATPPAYGVLTPTIVRARILGSGVRGFRVDYVTTGLIDSNSITVLSLSMPQNQGVENYTGNFAFSIYTDTIQGDVVVSAGFIPYEKLWRVGMRVFYRLQVVDVYSGVQVAEYKSYINVT